MEYSLSQHLENFEREKIEFQPFRRAADGRVDPKQEIRRSPISERKTVESYFGFLDSSYLEYLQNLNRQIPPLAPGTRAIVLAPARFEELHIERFLTMYDRQIGLKGKRLREDYFEILVLNNHFESEEPDGIKEIIEDYKKIRKSAFPIHFVSVVFPDSEPYPLTRARKTLADLALLRIWNTASRGQCTYLVSEDVDCLWLAPRFIDIVVATLDNYRFADSIRGQQDRAPWIMKDHEGLLLLRRSWNFTEAIMAQPRFHPGRYANYDFNWNRLTTSGWSCAFTAEVYALIHGYTPNRRFCEDVDIGEKISVLRGNNLNGIFTPLVSTVIPASFRAEGSPRRWLHGIAKRIHPYSEENNYFNFFDKEIEKELRSLEKCEFQGIASEVARLTKDNRSFFEDLFSFDYQFLIERLKDRRIATRCYERVLKWLGFEHGDTELLEGRVVIRNISNVRRALRAFRERNQLAPNLTLQQGKPDGRNIWSAYV